MKGQNERGSCLFLMPGGIALRMSLMRGSSVEIYHHTIDIGMISFRRSHREEGGRENIVSFHYAGRLFLRKTLMKGSYGDIDPRPIDIGMISFGRFFLCCCRRIRRGEKLCLFIMLRDSNLHKRLMRGSYEEIHHHTIDIGIIRL